MTQSLLDSCLQTRRGGNKERLVARIWVALNGQKSEGFEEFLKTHKKMTFNGLHEQYDEHLPAQYRAEKKEEATEQVTEQVEHAPEQVTEQVEETPVQVTVQEPVQVTEPQDSLPAGLSELIEKAREQGITIEPKMRRRIMGLPSADWYVCDAPWAKEVRGVRYATQFMIRTNLEVA